MLTWSKQRPEMEVIKQYIISDPLVQISIDDSRNILYTRSEKGTIQVFLN